MFVCVSPNPAIDKRLRVQRLVPGRVNRAVETRPAPGGKAAHVAMVLRELGADPLWIGFTGGASGQELLAGLQELKIRTHPVPIDKHTRVNLEIIDEDGAVTELLEPGPETSLAEAKAFQDACEEILAGAHGQAIAILSGSVPPGVPQGIYSMLIRRAHELGCRAFLDASGEPLQIGLLARPDFVKPNREEAEWLTGIVIKDPASAAHSIRQLISAGAMSAAISLGENGLVWRPAQSETIYYAHPAKVAVRSTVGCGDATIAAFAFAADAGLPREESLRLAAACGAANCLAEAPGCVKAGHIQRLRGEVRIETVS